MALSKPAVDPSKVGAPPPAIQFGKNAKKDGAAGSSAAVSALTAPRAFSVSAVTRLITQHPWQTSAVAGGAEQAGLQVIATVARASCTRAAAG